MGTTLGEVSEDLSIGVKALGEAVEEAPKVVSEVEKGVEELYTAGKNFVEETLGGSSAKGTSTQEVPRITLPKSKYPEAVQHAQDVMKQTGNTTYEIDRAGAAARRAQSLKDTPVRSGFDRDEWPPAIFKEGGAGASVRYIIPADNRGLGAFLGNHLRPFGNGTRVMIDIGE